MLGDVSYQEIRLVELGKSTQNLKMTAVGIQRRLVA
jgi:hypothetical protein